MSGVVVPISGGMDSTVLLHHAAANYDDVYAISFDYGQRHIKELECAQFQVNVLKDKIRKHQIINLPFFRDIGASSLTDHSINVAKTRDVCGEAQTVNYVPFRNMMLLSIACSFAESFGANTVYHGAAQADSVAGFWDGADSFIHAINDVIKLNRMNKISIKAPLISKSKQEIIEMGISLGVDFNRTWTCYEGTDSACGECTACSLRLQGFIQAGIRDPLFYSKSIPWEQLIN